MAETLAARREMLTREVLPKLADSVREAPRFDATLRASGRLATGTLGCFQGPQPFHQPLPRRRGESVPGPGGAHQPAALPVAEDQGVECPPALRVSADHELAGPVQRILRHAPERLPGS